MSKVVRQENERPNVERPIRFFASRKTLAAWTTPQALATALACSFILLCSFVFCSFAVAQDDSAEVSNKKKPKVEFLECKVRVTDPDGNPVEDATVYFRGLRTRVRPGDYWVWDESGYGMPAPRVKTDKNGVAGVKCPKFASEKLEVGTLAIAVKHQDFVPFGGEYDVGELPAEAQLKRGFRVAIFARNAKTGDRITDDLYAAIGLRGSAKWELKKNGMLVSGVYPKQKCYLRVMQMSEGQPTLFSKMITVDPGDRSRVLLRDIELSLGVRLEGKLHKSVKRPVENGYVAGMVCIKIEPNDWATQWSWSDRAKVNEDGTFVFESLPRDMVWQMIPICENWVPGQPKLESIAEHFPSHVDRFQALLASRSVPQLMKLKGESVSTVLEMKPAASVKIKFVDPGGKPISGVKAALAPNHVWFNGGSTILGSSHPTRKYMVNARHGKSVKRERSNRYSGKTDASGVVCIENLPAATANWLYAEHEQFELPIADGRRLYTFELREAEQKEITVRLVPKGKGPELGEGLAGDEAKAKIDFSGLPAAMKGMLNWIL